MPPLKAFIDDTTIICQMSERLDDLMSWCRMYFKPNKLRSFSVRKGKLDAAATFTVANKQILTVSEEPIKILGRWYDSSMKDTKRGQETAEPVPEGLIARSRLHGKSKLCLQFMLAPKLLWPTIYKVCSTTIETVEV